MPLYRAFGLTIDSELSLPEMASAEAGPVDVTIHWEEGAAPSEQCLGGGFHFRPDGISFHVREGSEIHIWSPPGMARTDISIWLLGTVMAALLHQRGLLTLHANCLVAPDGRAIAIAGDSGSGKSSLAAAAARAGWQVLGDDLCAVDPERLSVWPGVQRLKLWADSLERLGLDPQAYDRVASDLDKYHVPATVTAFDKSYLLDRLYLLANGNEFGVERLAGAAAADALFSELYRFEVGQQVRAHPASQFEQALALTVRLPIWRFTRPWDAARIDEGLARIARHLAGT